VPLKGSVEVVKALIQGEGDFSTLAVPLVQQFGAKGMVRALVVLNEKRNAAIPDVPTYKEEKLDVPRLTVWAGLAVPVGTPQEAIDYLEKASLEAAGNPELQKQLRSAGMDPAAIPAADFGKTWKADYAWIAKAAAEAKPNLTN
jgi:tripartite-type tricarboxylate transporter receptor subunit TctC